MKTRKFNLTQLGGYYMTPRVVMKSDKLSSPAKKVLCYLMTLWTSTDDIHPSVATIADITDQSESGVKRGIKELTDKGLIKVLQKGNGYGHSNSYAVNVTGINRFFDCDILIDETKKEEQKKETAPKVNGIPEQKANNGLPSPDWDPLGWMKSDYYKKARKENEMAEKAKMEWEPILDCQEMYAER